MNDSTKPNGNEPASAQSLLTTWLGPNLKENTVNSKDDETCRMLAASSVVGMPIRAAMEELDALRCAVAPFARLVKETNGRIPTEQLSFADWHMLARAAAMGPNV